MLVDSRKHMGLYYGML